MTVEVIKPFFEKIGKLDSTDKKADGLVNGKPVFADQQIQGDYSQYATMDSSNPRKQDLGQSIFDQVLDKFKGEGGDLSLRNTEKPVINPAITPENRNSDLELLGLLLRLLANKDSQNTGNTGLEARTPAATAGSDANPTEQKYNLLGQLFALLLGRGQSNQGVNRLSETGALHNTGLPPRAGSVATGPINSQIAQAALNSKGMSTANGPGGGNVACAWVVDKVLKQQGINLGAENPNSVVSTEKALKSKGQQISASEVQAGDIVVTTGPNGKRNHIGIAMGNGKVLSNSSSNKSFSWVSGLNFDGHYGNQQVRYYRVTA